MHGPVASPVRRWRHPLHTPIGRRGVVEHQRQDIIFVVLPGRLATKNVCCAPQMGFELLLSEPHLNRNLLRQFSGKSNELVEWFEAALKGLVIGRIESGNRYA